MRAPGRRVHDNSAFSAMGARVAAGILVYNDGPYEINGEITITAEDGTVLHASGQTWLCRCGGSGNKPFCDGTHRKIGFKDTQPHAAHADEAFVAVASVAEVPEGELLGAEVNGRPVVLGNVKGEIFCIGGICSHEFAKLADGDLDGDTVLCPLHNSGFNIRTGAARGLPAERPVPSFEVKVQDGQVLVAAEPKA
jgi:3-phenylpropionate/trans-cinnamate dioxygenase ferredoxin subunit